MNQFKLVFISVFVMASIVGTAVSLGQIVLGQGRVAWVGALVTFMAIIIYFIQLYRYQTTRIAQYVGPVAVVLSAGLFLTVIGGVLSKDWLPLVLSLIMSAGWYIYVNLAQP